MTDRKVFVSAKEVADRAGVSRSAVSRTFTPGASVSDETRRKVMDAADALGYHVNHLARGLMLNESGIVCLVVSELDTPYRAGLIKALTSQLQAASKVAMLINTDRSDQSVEVALRQAIRYRADASIILSGMPDKSIINLCLRNGQRLVLINRDDAHDGPLRINLDDRAAARQAFTALLRGGCREFGFANSQAMTPSLMAREQGFVAAAWEHGLTVSVERFGSTSYQSGIVLAQRFMTRAKRPDAVFCATDLLACGFMDAVRHQFKLDIPSEICVVGFDDIEQASWSSYDLTTFAQPVDMIAAEAICMAEQTCASYRERQYAQIACRSGLALLRPGPVDLRVPRIRFPTGKPVSIGAISEVQGRKGGIVRMSRPCDGPSRQETPASPASRTCPCRNRRGRCEAAGMKLVRSLPCPIS